MCLCREHTRQRIQTLSTYRLDADRVERVHSAAPPELFTWRNERGDVPVAHEALIRKVNGVPQLVDFTLIEFEPRKWRPQNVRREKFGAKRCLVYDAFVGVPARVTNCLRCRARAFLHVVLALCTSMHPRQVGADCEAAVRHVTLEESPAGGCALAKHDMSW